MAYEYDFKKIENGRYALIQNGSEIGTVERGESATRTYWGIWVDGKCIAGGRSRFDALESAVNSSRLPF